MERLEVTGETQTRNKRACVQCSKEFEVRPSSVVFKAPSDGASSSITSKKVHPREEPFIKDFVRSMHVCEMI